MLLLHSSQSRAYQTVQGLTKAGGNQYVWFSTSGVLLSFILLFPQVSLQLKKTCVYHYGTKDNWLRLTPFNTIIGIIFHTRNLTKLWHKKKEGQTPTSSATYSMKYHGGLCNHHLCV